LVCGLFERNIGILPLKFFFIKQFFDSSNRLWVIAVLNVKIGPKCRNKDWVLGQKRVSDSV
jgi:hypothetical protein